MGACGRPTLASSSASVFRHLFPIRGPRPSHPTSGPHPWLFANLNPATNWERALADCPWTKGICIYKLSYGSRLARSRLAALVRFHFCGTRAEETYPQPPCQTAVSVCPFLFAGMTLYTPCHPRGSCCTSCQQTHRVLRGEVAGSCMYPTVSATTGRRAMWSFIFPITPSLTLACRSASP